MQKFNIYTSMDKIVTKHEGKRNCIDLVIIYLYTCVSMTVQLALDYKAGEIENRRRSFHFSEFHNFDQS
jgi:hypothetical protein